MKESDQPGSPRRRRNSHCARRRGQERAAHVPAAFRSARAQQDLRRQPPQVVHHDQAQHDRNGPQLADRQGGYRLERLDEARDVALVQATVAVGHQLQRHGVNARQAVERSSLDLRQELIVPARQIGADFDQGFGDDMEIVEQPFGVRAEPLLTAVSGADLPVGGQEAAAVVHETPQQRSAGHDRRPARVGGQLAGVGLQPIQAEQLRPHRLMAQRIAEKMIRRPNRSSDRGPRLRGGHYDCLPHTDPHPAVRADRGRIPSALGSVFRK